MAGQFITFCRNVSPVNEQKVIFLFCCSIEYFQPTLQPNSEQKLMKCASRPAIANALVRRMALLSQTKPDFRLDNYLRYIAPILLQINYCSCRTHQEL